MGSRYKDPYLDYNPDSFIIKAKRTVYKWWCVVYRPVYRLVHNGDWPEDRNPENVYPYTAPSTDTDAIKMAEQILHEKEAATADIIESVLQEAGEVDAAMTVNETAGGTPDEHDVTHNTAADDGTADITTVDDTVLSRANEIMERLAREAAEDEAKKQAEIEAARRKAEENERLAIIMQANQVDISSYIEEGKAHQKDFNNMEAQ